MGFVEEIKKQDRWHHYIAYSSIAFFISLFLPWVSTVIVSQSGWQKEGWILLLPVVYNIWFARGKTKGKKVAYGINILSVLVLVNYYISEMSISFFGREINVAGDGLYLALFSFLVNLYFISQIKEIKLEDSKGEKMKPQKQKKVGAGKTTSKFYHGCGTKLEGSAKFCSGCGEKIKK